MFCTVRCSRYQVPRRTKFHVALDCCHKRRALAMLFGMSTFSAKLKHLHSEAVRQYTLRQETLKCRPFKKAAQNRGKMAKRMWSKSFIKERDSFNI